MYKKLLFVVLFFSAAGLYSQSLPEVDRRVAGYPHFSSLKDLGIRIQNDFDSDSLRIRAAFMWVANNIRYERIRQANEPDKHRITYSSESEKEEAIEELVWFKINKAFRLRKGVCIDYSLMLNALFEQFGLSSKIITGIVKTKIEEIKGTPSYSNHSWNAVQLKGQWRLMDATWAAGFVDTATGQFVRNFSDHYFFTDPSDFIRHHLPSNEEWQLLDKPVDPATFFAAPIYLPDYCGKDIRLSSRTKGILSMAERDENYIYFDRLPADHLLYYTINGRGEIRRMGLRRVKENAYVSKIRLRKRFNRSYDYLTIYLNDDPILNFRIEENLPKVPMMTDIAGQKGAAQNSD